MLTAISSTLLYFPSPLILPLISYNPPNPRILPLINYDLQKHLVVADRGYKNKAQSQ